MFSDCHILLQICKTITIILYKVIENVLAETENFELHVECFI